MSNDASLHFVNHLWFGVTFSFHISPFPFHLPNPTTPYIHVSEYVIVALPARAPKRDKESQATACHFHGDRVELALLIRASTAQGRAGAWLPYLFLLPSTLCRRLACCPHPPCISRANTRWTAGAAHRLHFEAAEFPFFSHKAVVMRVALAQPTPRSPETEDAFTWRGKSSASARVLTEAPTSATRCTMRSR
jgi:hypothetical protein